jgi:hypothetical protein
MILYVFRFQNFWLIFIALIKLITFKTLINTNNFSAFVSLGDLQ